MAPKWTKIRTEYVTGSSGYRALAEKYKVPLKTLAQHAKADGWVEARKQYRHETATKATEAIGNRQVDALARINTISDALLDKLEAAVGELDMTATQHIKRVGDKDDYVETKSLTFRHGGQIDQKALRNLTAALKDLREIKGIQSELAKQEQEARIANLRKQANPTGELDSSKYGIVMLPPVQPLTPPDDEGDADG